MIGSDKKSARTWAKRLHIAIQVNYNKTAEYLWNFLKKKSLALYKIPKNKNLTFLLFLGIQRIIVKFNCIAKGWRRRRSSIVQDARE